MRRSSRTAPARRLVWAEDTGASAKNDASSSTITYPTLTPTSSGELYVGFSRASSRSYLGNTAGFTYELAKPKYLYTYDPDVTGSVSPITSQHGGLSVTTGALIEAS